MMDGHLRADDRTVLGFAHRLYEQAEDPGGLEQGLCSIADSLHAVVVCVHRYEITRRRGEAVRVLRGLTPDQVREYREHHAAHNPWMLGLRAPPNVSDVLAGHELCPADELLRHRFYHDFLAPKGLLDLLATVVETDAAILETVNMLRGEDPGRFVGVEIALMRRLAPHLCNAFRMNRRFAEIRRSRDLLADVISCIQTAVIAIDSDLRVIEANHAADSLLETNDGLRVNRGTLEVCDNVGRDALREVVGRLAKTDHGDDTFAGGSFSIERPSGANAYSATAVPTQALTTTCGRRFCCLLFIEDPELDDDIPDPVRIQQLWSLTPTEARVAAMLAGGMSTREISERLEISFNTVRCYVSRIYGKTDTSRQTELVRLLTRLGITVRCRRDDAT